MPSSMRRAATWARCSSSWPVSLRRWGARACCPADRSIQARYWVTRLPSFRLGIGAVGQAGRARPSRARCLAAPRGPLVPPRLRESSRCGLRWQWQSVSTASVATLWPTANSQASRILQVGHPLIPVVAVQAAEVGTRDEGLLALHLQLSLEGKRLVASLVRGGIAAVDQEHRDGPGSLRQPALGAVAGDRANRQGDLQAVAAADVGLARFPGGLGELQLDVFDPLRAFPLRAVAMAVGRACGACSRPSGRERVRRRAFWGTSTLRPIDDGRNRLRADAGSVGVASSAPPASLAASTSSLLSSSTRWRSPASSGTRNPVRYQREGAWGSTSVREPKPSRGPTRSSWRASASLLLTSAAVMSGTFVLLSICTLAR